jgi:hypothetical protein
MRTSGKVLAWVLAAVTIVLALVVRSTVVSGQSQISSRERESQRRSQPPDPPCFDNMNRYVNCGNGAVTDTATGLIWLQDAGCLGSLTWAEANQAAAALENGQCGLTDHSKPGDWRLPSNAEWNAMVDAAKNHPLLHCANPALTDDSGSACFGDGSGSSFLNVALDGYWSSTTYAQSGGLLPDGTKAGTLPLSNGFLLTFFSKGCCPQPVWPVRVH